MPSVASYAPNSTDTPAYYFHNFSSFHPAGTNFLSADGAVHLVAETVDQQVCHALCTRATGDVVGKY